MAGAWRKRAIDPDRWAIPYADFVTLLFALFAVLYAVSALDAQRFASVASAFRVAFADQPGAPTRPIPLRPLADAGDGRAAGTSQASEQGSAFDRMRSELAARLEPLLAEGVPPSALRVAVAERGLVVSLGMEAFFEPDAAALRPAAQTAVEAVAASVRGHPGPLRIETRAKARSGWPRAARLSVAVADALAEHLPSRQLSAVAYGAAASDDVEHRAAAARVDVVLLSTGAAGAEAPDRRGGDELRSLLDQLAPAERGAAGSADAGLLGVPDGDR